MTFGEKLQELRRKAGMSQDALAEKLGVSRQAVSKWERDEAVPETEKVLRIAKLFDVSLDELLLDREQKAEPTHEPRYQQLQNQDDRRNSGARVERFIRRHGYKVGYAMIAAGLVIILVCLCLRGFWMGTVSGMSDSFNSFVTSMGGGFAISGGVDGFTNPLFGGFNQSVQSMTNTAAGWGNVFLLGLIPGIGLAAAGIIIIIKGRKLARETEC